MEIAHNFFLFIQNMGKLKRKEHNFTLRERPASWRAKSNIKIQSSLIFPYQKLNK